VEWMALGGVVVHDARIRVALLAVLGHLAGLGFRV
jgi:hypothetical protein